MVANATLGRRTDAVGRAASGLPWWLLLVTGALWVVVSWLVLGFNSQSVNAIAALAGAIMLAAGVAELYLMFVAPGWKWLHAGLGALFIVTGIICWINPGKTFFWLSAFIGWYLLFKGIADIILSLATKAENEAWWLLLIVGIFEVLAGFWAAGRFGRSAYLLVVLVGVIALTRGITDIVMAFRVRKLQETPTTPTELPTTPTAPTTSAAPTTPASRPTARPAT